VARGLEMQAEKFLTVVASKDRGIITITNKIQYGCDLENPCFSNGFVYVPSGGSIIRINPATGEQKNFVVPVINSATKLHKRGAKFVAVEKRRSTR